MKNEKSVEGIDGVTSYYLQFFAKKYPRKHIVFTHHFSDGIEGKQCGFVPSDCDGTIIVMTPRWVVEYQDRKTST